MNSSVKFELWLAKEPHPPAAVPFGAETGRLCECLTRFAQKSNTLNQYLMFQREKSASLPPLPPTPSPHYYVGRGKGFCSVTTCIMVCLIYQLNVENRRTSRKVIFQNIPFHTASTGPSVSHSVLETRMRSPPWSALSEAFFAR